jgi:hypothetical protein
MQSRGLARVHRELGSLWGATRHAAGYRRHPFATRYMSSARYAAALTAINSLPELASAKATPDASAAYDYFKRALEIVGKAGDPKLVIVAHGYLARHAYTIGDAATERAHRVAVIDGLRNEAAAAGADNDPETTSLLASAYNGLALTCLRVAGSESLLAAGAAADAAERHSVSAHSRVAASLHAALARPRGSEGQRMLLSAIASMEVEDDPLDIPGFASFFLGLFADEDAGGASDKECLRRLRDVIERWKGRDDFDLVEIQCATARELMRRGSRSSPDRGYSRLGRDAVDDAEDILAAALATSQRLGNKLDMSEPLLGLAILYHATKRNVEAEGLFRSVEERFSALERRKAFTVVSAELCCRMLDAFATFLSDVGRGREAEMKRARAAEIRAMFPSILGQEPHVPLWFVDSCIELYAVPQPLL